MKKYIAILLFIFSVILISCDSDTENNINEVPIVEAFLYTGHPLDSIRIVKTLDFFSSSDQNIITDNLDVIIETENESYNFIQSEHNSEYYLNTSEELIIQENVEYFIRFNFNDTEIYSSTTGQDFAEDFSISDTVVYIDDDLFGGSFGEENNISITWNNSTEEYYMLNIQLTDTTSLDDKKIFDNAENPPYSMLIPPMNFNSFELNTRMLQYFGNYRIVLYKVNDEFIEFLEGINQNSSNLVEVPTNIINGKGIFTAMSSDTLYLEVTSE